MKRIERASPPRKARLAGFFYLLTILTGALALAFVPGRTAVNLVATACYLAVTVLFYGLFKPVNRAVSLLAAFFSLVGCVLGALSTFHLKPVPINSLVFFGFYCLLLGYLIFRSTFLPRTLGGVMALAGLGWLTFVSPPLVQVLFPYNVAVPALAETSLSLWLLVRGLKEERWVEQARAAADRRGQSHRG